MTAHYLDHWLDEHVDDPAAWSPAPPGAGRLLPPTPPAPADAAYPLPPRTPPLAPWRALEGTAYLVLVEGEAVHVRRPGQRPLVPKTGGYALSVRGRARWYSFRDLAAAFGGSIAL
jgi:hypothetical protein